MTVRSRSSSPRIASSSAIASLSLASSSSSSVRPSRVSRPSGHVEDVVGLRLGELERSRHQAGPSCGAVRRRPDQRDDGVDHVDGLEEALDDVGAVLGLLEAELRAAGEHLDLVGDVGGQQLLQVERAGDPVDQRDHVHREGGLHRRVAVQVVEDDVGRRVLAELDHEPGDALRRLVADGADPFDVLALDGGGDLLLDALHGGLVGDGVDDDLLAAWSLLDLGDRPHADRAPARPVGVEDAGAAHDQAAGGEVGPGHGAARARRRRRQGWR